MPPFAAGADGNVERDTAAGSSAAGKGTPVTEHEQHEDERMDVTDPAMPGEANPSAHEPVLYDDEDADE